MKLQAFDFEILHRKGSENIVADMLSRLPNVDELNLTDILGFETNEFESEEYINLIAHIKENKDKLPDIKIENNLIYKKLGFGS